MHRRTLAEAMGAKGRGIAVAALVMSALATGCTSGGGGDGTIKLTIGVFGDFGYHDLYRKYEAEHPNIEIVEHVTAFADHHNNLAAHLGTGTGADDIESIETSYIARFTAQPGRFVDLNQYGAGRLMGRWLPWKWQQSLSRDGHQIGLGTDIGGLAICYRTDLFRRAGLPTDRERVSALWPDWPAYVRLGQQFEARRLGAHWFDSGSNIFNAIIAQAETGYYDADGKIVVGTNPAVRDAWDITMRAVAAGESARLTAFSNEWNTGFQKSQFATVTCPAWMMGYIQDQAKSSAGRWDIATIPGGSGNWGGSFLTVPKQSKHPREAYDLAAWLTAPAQQIFVFKQTGNLPSQPQLYSDPAVVNFKNPFFSNAPVGQIFTTSAREVQPQHHGPRTGDITLAFLNAIGRVEQSRQDAAASWAQLLDDVDRLAQ